MIDDARRAEIEAEERARFAEEQAVRQAARARIEAEHAATGNDAATTPAAASSGRDFSTMAKLAGTYVAVEHPLIGMIAADQMLANETDPPGEPHCSGSAAPAACFWSSAPSAWSCSASSRWRCCRR